jgi:isovaleryl-CoA dehydrogenase
MGMRGSPTAELVFTDCEVPEENVMGPLNGGVGRPDERPRLRAHRAGRGHSARHHAGMPRRRPALSPRTQAVRPGDRQLPADAGQGRRHVCRAQFRPRLCLCRRPACDAGKTTRFDAAGAILLASENAFKVAGEAVQALGGAGYTKDWPVERFLRDAKLLDIGAGTNEIRRMLIGRELLGG